MHVGTFISAKILAILLFCWLEENLFLLHEVCTQVQSCSFANIYNHSDLLSHQNLALREDTGFYLLSSIPSNIPLWNKGLLCKTKNVIHPLSNMFNYLTTAWPTDVEVSHFQSGSLLSLWTVTLNSIIPSDHQNFFMKFPSNSISCCSAAALPREDNEHHHRGWQCYTRSFVAAWLLQQKDCTVLYKWWPKLQSYELCFHLFKDRSIPHRKGAASNYLQSKLLARQDLRAAKSGLRDKYHLVQHQHTSPLHKASFIQCSRNSAPEFFRWTKPEWRFLKYTQFINAKHEYKTQNTLK